MKDLVNLGVNIVALEKKDHKYGMTCAWMTQIDEDKLIMLIGSQSETVKHIEEGDFIGVSALSELQVDIAKRFGESHSKKVNKFSNLSYENEDGAIMINKACRLMKCRVLSIGRIVDNDEDYLIQVEVVSMECNSNKFLSMTKYRDLTED